MNTMISSPLTVNKLNFEDPESHLDSLSTSNSVTDNQQSNIIEDDKSILSNDESLYLELDKLNRDKLIKPAHWSDSYWLEITSNFKWFLHKDDFAGCNICLNCKIHAGNNGKLQSMRMYILDLSYKDFELKLTKHEETERHRKSKSILKQKFNCDISDSPSVNTSNFLEQSRSQSHETTNVRTGKEKLSNKPYTCPQCGKFYSFKKSLVNHIHTCSGEQNAFNFDLPCKCQIKHIFSLHGIDEHVTKSHMNKILYVCHICNNEIDGTTSMFEHLFMNHNYYWDPYLEFPDVIDKSDHGGYHRRKLERKPVMNENEENIKSRFLNAKKHNLKRNINENSDIKSEMIKLTPSVTVSLDDIVTCTICGSRYLNQDILNSHNAKYHVIAKKDEV